MEEHLNQSTPAQPGPGPYGPQTAPLAIVGLILSFIPFCMLSMVGMVLGIVALGQIKARPQELKGRGLAIGAIAIGAFWAMAVGNVDGDSGLDVWVIDDQGIHDNLANDVSSYR